MTELDLVFHYLAALLPVALQVENVLALWGGEGEEGGKNWTLLELIIYLYNRLFIVSTISTKLFF